MMLCLFMFFFLVATCRPVGFDIQKGECVLQAGDALGAAELGLLASIGVTKVLV